MKKFNWLYILFLILFGCSSEEPDVFLDKGIDFPDQESWGVTIILTDSSIERARVNAGHLEKYNQKKHILLDELVQVDFFDKKQIHVAVLNSYIAEVDQKTNNMKAVGNVVAISDSGITLFTDTLYWDSKNEKMSTLDSIMITTLDEDTLYGIGFESDSDLENWKILNPSGVTRRN
jgi:LPS export ABC transporter protein LptC|tara:strand:+ start:667 stop:1194 length:528 start_codon:yes stop_codon:yes gene_type:complete